VEEIKDALGEREEEARELKEIVHQRDIALQDRQAALRESNEHARQASNNPKP
jgi:hypothetical protein